MKAPKYDIKNPDGSNTPFYPILCAVSPEWNVITREEIRGILYPLFIKQADAAYESAIENSADHIWGTEYLAWGLEK